MLKDAFPDSSATLMVGSPGIGMLEVAVSIAKEWMDGGDRVVFIAVDLLPADLIEVMSAFGVSEEQRNEHLCIIDYPSSLLGSMDGRTACQGTDIKRCSDLEGIMFNISAMASDAERPLRIIMHSLSTLFLYNQANVVLKFVQISSSRIHNDLSTAIFTVNEGVHDERTVNHLMAISDGVMELKFDENLHRRMRIRNMRGCVTSSKWTPFDIRQVE
mgnify:FL=1